MKANKTETRSTLRRRTRLAGIAVVAMLGVTACQSDPGPKRVARDIIEREAIENPDLDEQCLLDELDKFSNGDLKAIDEDLAADNSERNEAGEAALAAFELSLARCN